jgi:hypothetical protein
VIDRGLLHLPAREERRRNRVERPSLSSSSLLVVAKLSLPSSSHRSIAALTTSNPSGLSPCLFSATEYTPLSSAPPCFAAAVSTPVVIGPGFYARCFRLGEPAPRIQTRLEAGELAEVRFVAQSSAFATL